MGSDSKQEKIGENMESLHLDDDKNVPIQGGLLWI